jgi:anthranilate synthase/aminodeoxychorismate synthase-like glutamine amidotransferase
LAPPKRVVLLDNHDSFTWNLADLLMTAAQAAQIAMTVDVIRNTDENLLALQANLPDALVISPGPNAPDDAGALVPFLRAVLGKLPIWGVCLGHQAIAVALGGQVLRAPEPIHGRQALVLHTARGLFAALPQPFLAMRYHSLVVDRATLPADLAVTAWLDDGLIMAMHSDKWLCTSVQFHPESVGTPLGRELAQAAATWLTQQGAK